MKYFFAILCCCLTSIGYSQDKILIDGIFEDWENKAILYTDATGDDGISNIDFGKLQIHNDDNFIFFLLEVGEEINFQDLNEITMYIDADNNAATGKSVNGIGVELEYTFGERRGRLYSSTGSIEQVSHPNVGLISAPTVSSTTFEWMIVKSITAFDLPLFSDNGFKIVLRDNSSNGDLLPTSGEELSYSFVDEVQEPLPSYTIQAPSSSDFRVLSYNVLSDGLMGSNRLPFFTRILQSLEPSIIGFQEIYDHTPEQVAARVESILPSGAGETWYHAGVEEDIQVISRYPILETHLISIDGGISGNGAFLIDIPNLEEPLLFINAHPPCCSNNFFRQEEIDAIMAFIRNVKDGTGPFQLPEDSPIIIVGDMNLVGFNQQLATFLSGDILNEAVYGADFTPDWDGGNLKDSNPFTTNLPNVFTWYSTNSPFSPGKLDYILYSGSNLAIENSFSLFTNSLPTDSLTTYSLNQSDAANASDHLPVVADFSLKNPTSVINPTAAIGFRLVNVTPSPAQDRLELSLEISEAADFTIQLLSSSGQILTTLLDERLLQGAQTLEFDCSALPNGTYILQMKNTAFSISRKVMIVR